MSTTGKILIAERLAALAAETSEIEALMKQHPEAAYDRPARELHDAAEMMAHWAHELERYT
jgi:hypothetical protein